MEFIRMKCLNPQRIQHCGNPLIHYWQFSVLDCQTTIFLCCIHCSWSLWLTATYLKISLGAIFHLLLFQFSRFLMQRSVFQLENLQLATNFNFHNNSIAPKRIWIVGCNKMVCNQHSFHWYYCSENYNNLLENIHLKVSAVDHSFILLSRYAEPQYLNIKWRIRRVEEGATKNIGRNKV